MSRLRVALPRELEFLPNELLVGFEFSHFSLAGDLTGCFVLFESPHSLV
jgi:hypothetical protein